MARRLVQTVMRLMSLKASTGIGRRILYDFQLQNCETEEFVSVGNWPLGPTQSGLSEQRAGVVPVETCFRTEMQAVGRAGRSMLLRSSVQNNWNS